MQASDKDKILEILKPAIQQRSLIKKNKIIFKKIHGWKYSYNYEKTPYLSIWNKKINLGICGDWLNGGRVEGAWLSGHKLAIQIEKM